MKKIDSKSENSEHQITWYYQAPKPNEPKQKIINKKEYLTGTGCDTNGKRVKLYCNIGQYVKTIPLNPGTNVGSMMTAPGVQMFHAYATQNQFHPSELSCFPVHVIPDNEESLQPPDPIAPPQEDNISLIQETIQALEEFYSTPATTTKDTENIVDWSLPNLIKEDESEPPLLR